MSESPTAKKVDLNIETPTAAGNVPDRVPTPEENYLKRKTEVTEQDYQEFIKYQQEKAQQKPARQSSSEPPKAADVKVKRRDFLTVVAGTAAVGEAAALAYTIKNQGVPAH